MDAREYTAMGDSLINLIVRFFRREFDQPLMIVPNREQEQILKALVIGAVCGTDNTLSLNKEALIQILMSIIERTKTVLKAEEHKRIRETVTKTALVVKRQLIRTVNLNT